ncbi:MAG TPA: hypothetical protein VK028_07840 [Micromonosporaceae bacterium]|nr:hypothetical protein [Micromonosporaceae bacterium]
MTSTISRDERLDHRLREPARWEPDGRQAAFNAAIDALLEASRGWPLTTPRAGQVPAADAREIAVQDLIDELGLELGLYLPPKDQERLRRSAPTDPDEFADAVLRAAGLEPALYPHLRWQAADRVRRHVG